jgi:RNA 2',3'-cyclic 3'-phosphodiesterase
LTTVNQHEPMWRCFVAVPISDRLRSELAAAVDAWRLEPDAPNLRWTDAGGWHVTLAFLGQVPPTLIAPIEAALNPVAARAASSRVAGGGLGAFPSRNRARVVWYRIEDPEERLADLASGVRLALEPFVPRLAEESSFRPHLTLARAREQRGLPLADWLAGHKAPAESIEVDRVVVYRSHLGRGPAQYEPLISLPFRMPTPASGDMKEASVND